MTPGEPGTEPAAGGGLLPRTGLGAGWIALIGIALLLLGVRLRVITRIKEVVRRYVTPRMRLRRSLEELRAAGVEEERRLAELGPQVEPSTPTARRIADVHECLDHADGRRHPARGRPALRQRRVPRARASTRSRFNLSIITMAAGRSGPEPHVHDDEDDAFLVLDDEMTFLLGDEELEGAGGHVRAGAAGRRAHLREPDRAAGADAQHPRARRLRPAPDVA